MNIFEDTSVPDHIQEANSLARLEFGRLRHEEERMARNLGLPFKDIDLAIAWQQFDAIYYGEYFKRITNSEDVADETIRGKIITATLNKLAILYHLEVLRIKGIMDIITNKGETVYLFKPAYKPSIKVLSKAWETRNPS